MDKAIVPLHKSLSDLLNSMQIEETRKIPFNIQSKKGKFGHNKLLLPAVLTGSIIYIPAWGLGAGLKGLKLYWKKIVTAWNYQKIIENYRNQGFISIDEVLPGTTPSMFERGEYIGGYPEPLADALLPREDYYVAPLKEVAHDSNLNNERVFTLGKIVECEAAQPTSYVEISGKFFVFSYYGSATIMPRSENFVVNHDRQTLSCTIGNHVIRGIHTVRTALSRHKVYNNGEVVFDPSYSPKQLDVLLNTFKLQEQNLIIGGVNVGGRLIVDTLLTPQKEAYIFNLLPSPL